MKLRGFSPRTWIVLAAAAGLVYLAVTRACDRTGPRPIVYASHSLTDYLQDVATRYRDHTGAEVRLSFGSSGTLRRKIEAGRGADLFVSESLVDLDALQGAGLILRRADLMRNRLVLLEKESRPGWEKRILARDGTLRRPDSGRIAIADPDRASPGRYVREALETMGLWEGVRDRLVRADRARHVIDLVLEGEAEMGVAYRTDARAVEGLRVLWVFPEERHSPILYVGAVIRGGDQTEGAIRFLDYLSARARRGVIEDHGFVLPR